MTDLNKVRSEFEDVKEIQDSIRREQLIFNTKLGCYTKKSGKMCVSANWTNGAWFVFERKAKAKAVPEGYVLVPKEPTKEMIKAVIDEAIRSPHLVDFYKVMINTGQLLGSKLGA